MEWDQNYLFWKMNRRWKQVHIHEAIQETIREYEINNHCRIVSNDLFEVLKDKLKALQTIEHYATKWANGNDLALASIGREILLMVDGKIKLPEPPEVE